MTIDAQEMQDQEMSHKNIDVSGSKARLEASLARKNGNSLEPAPSSGYDPIASAMKDNPRLTRETAEEVAKEFGF
jgi:hypothetical protein